MKQGQMPRRRRYPQLLKEYEHRVMESLVAALPAEDIKAKVGLLYRGYYGNIIKELKGIMERRP